MPNFNIGPRWNTDIKVTAWGDLPTVNDGTYAWNSVTADQKLAFRSLLQKNTLNGSSSSTPVCRLIDVSSYFEWTKVGFSGAVMGLNGDIYFVPWDSISGGTLTILKISVNGTISTLSSLLQVARGYHGGVLAPNGDIHFVPYNATVGQKISASGVLSTYSLTYTTNTAYVGGVLDPLNGDIHFIPHAAAVGQLVSTSGVVSTYSLTYTASGAYSGGVLDSNGVIHMIPYNATVGQNIKNVGAAKYTGTYSLVYTTNAAYRGGVLDGNGDVHFIPYAAAVGQKISSPAAFTVSTYSLIYTISNLHGSFASGVLTPNGEVHFIPNNQSIGQKISLNGVVSTYSVEKGNQGSLFGPHRGGIINLNGEIVCVSDSPSQYVQIISVCPGKVFPPSVCMSPFFNKF